MNITDALKILGLSTPVNEEDIRKAFRSKAKLYHPDREVDQGRKQEATNKFIQARKAHDHLLSMDIAYINDFRLRSQAAREREPAVRRTTRPAAQRPRAQVVIVESPLVKELDNVARLFHLINKKGQSIPAWKWMMNFTFSPAFWLGRWYEILIENKYSIEKRLGGVAYSFYHFFRLLIGSIFLIAGFIAISILGIVILPLFFPPAMVFLAMYFVYRNILGFFKEAWKSGSPGVVTVQLKYLMVRTFPVVLMLLAGQLIILVLRDESYYMQTMSWILIIPLILLALSVTYEWLQYFSLKEEKV